MSSEQKLQETIEAKIYTIRGQKVMLDSDLAKLYGVETKRLNEQVRRNIERFPQDFMFQLTADEVEIQRSQSATFEFETLNRKYKPFVFTENGVAMLSSVLGSPQAIQINISIMRIFTKLRSFLFLERDLSERIDDLESGTNKAFKLIFERMDSLEEMVTPVLPEKRKRVGLTSKD